MNHFQAIITNVSGGRRLWKTFGTKQGLYEAADNLAGELMETGNPNNVSVEVQGYRPSDGLVFGNKVVVQVV